MAQSSWLWLKHKKQKILIIGVQTRNLDVNLHISVEFFDAGHIWCMKRQRVKFLIFCSKRLAFNKCSNYWHASKLLELICTILKENRESNSIFSTWLECMFRLPLANTVCIHILPSVCGCGWEQMRTNGNMSLFLLKFKLADRNECKPRSFWSMNTVEWKSKTPFHSFVDFHFCDELNFQPIASNFDGAFNESSSFLFDSTHFEGVD